MVAGLYQALLNFEKETCQLLISDDKSICHRKLRKIEVVFLAKMYCALLFFCCRGVSEVETSSRNTPMFECFNHEGRKLSKI